MNRKTPFAVQIAFRPPQSLDTQSEAWTHPEDRPLANLVCTFVKHAVAECERSVEPTCVQKETK